ncbi:DUF6125 family protein [bacterium]|nr:DUF6125 family protein [bacterium]
MVPALTQDGGSSYTCLDKIYGGLTVHNDLNREELLALITAYTKSWLAHDGCWFLSVEAEKGLEEAIHFDEEAWRRFAPVEARRVMEARGIEPGGGLPTLAEALSYRMYRFINEQKLELSEDKLVFTMTKCRVQATRRRKGLLDFPCKSVGKIEFTEFAKAVDERIETRCLGCPPDDQPDDRFCSWEFKLRKDETDD